MDNLIRIDPIYRIWYAIDILVPADTFLDSFRPPRTIIHADFYGIIKVCNLSGFRAALMVGEEIAGV